MFYVSLWFSLNDRSKLEIWQQRISNRRFVNVLENDASAVYRRNPPETETIPKKIVG